MAQKMVTPPIGELLGYDIDTQPDHIVLVFKDAAGVEYGVQLTPTGLDKTMICAMQAVAERRKRSERNGQQSGPVFAEYTLTGCQHYRHEDERVSLAMEFEGMLKVAFPVTVAECELVIRESTAALAYLKKTGARGPKKQ
jgi:hypothetical protein